MCGGVGCLVLYECQIRRHNFDTLCRLPCTLKHSLTNSQTKDEKQLSSTIGWNVQQRTNYERKQASRASFVCVCRAVCYIDALFGNHFFMYLFRWCFFSRLFGSCCLHAFSRLSACKRKYCRWRQSTRERNRSEEKNNKPNDANYGSNINFPLFTYTTYVLLVVYKIVYDFWLSFPHIRRQKIFTLARFAKSLNDH